MAENDSIPDITVLKFSDSKIPEFKEVRNKDFILYGEKNNYPEYLTYLYNKSAKHNAIINGKCNYILGSGFSKKDNAPSSFTTVNRSGETLNELMQKTVKDIEIYGGFRWIIIWDVLGRGLEIFHDDFYRFRKDKDRDGFFYKTNWADNREQAIPYPEFNPDHRKGAQVFEYNEYRPGCNIYPLPGYVGSCNYIETDIEISKYNLSCIQNGMMPSKMVQIYTGGTEISEEKKGQLERKWEKKFTGSENGGRFILAWSPTKEKNIEIEDLSATEADKLFDLLNKTCQQEIFTGHQVVSPMLFGIKTEGQLGGTNELKVAYEIFINTYAKPKQYNLEKIVNYFGGLTGKGTDYYIEQLDPIGMQIDISSVISMLPKEFIFSKLNIPKEYWGAPTPITAPGAPATPRAAAPAEELATESTVNDNIKNLTAKQHQQLMRIIRQYSKGQITQAAATALLKAGLGLNDQDIASLLGIEDEEQFASADQNEDEIIQLFNACGDLKKDFHIVKSKAVKFTSDDDALNAEVHFFTHAFKTDVLITEADILDLIANDKKITPELIAKALDTTPEYITAKIAALIKKGLLKIKESQTGEDTQVERTLTKPLKDIIKIIGDDPNTTEISIKYSYEGPDDSRNRPFCKKMLNLDRLYSRFEIESISQKLGYSVFDRRGGFWRHKDGIITPYCRHRWESHIVVKKGKEATP